MSKKKVSFIETAMHYRQIVILVAVLLVVFGIWSLVNIPKNEFPNFTVRQGVVIAVYPGATSLEIEEQLTKPLEKFLWNYKEVKKRKTYSQSKDGMAIVFVELNDDVTDKDAFWSKFKHGIEGFKSQLPSGVLAVIVNDDFGDTSALLVTVESEDKTYRELEIYLDELEDRLRRIESLSNIRRYGTQKEQVGIYLDQEKLASYGISTPTLMTSLYSQGFTIMSGAVDNKRLVAPLHVKQNYLTEKDIAEQIVYSDPTGHLIRLKDIARIVREYPDPESYIRNNGKKCLLLSLEMNQGNNIVQFGNDVNQILEEYKKELPEEVNIYRITDQSQVVDDSVRNFLKELLIAIVAVIFVIMLLMPFKIAAVAASSIPITIFISLGLFMAFGIELNTVTLAALIVTLGMIVDNSIVIIDCYVEKLEQGVSRWYAAIMSAKEFLGSIFSATLAISITFFPFLITMKGMFKDFLLSFPWAITIILGISLLVAILLIPYMQYFFIREGLNVKKKGKKSFLDIVQSGYKKLLDICFKNPKWTLICGFSFVVAGIVLFMHLPQRLMPVAERNQFAVEIYLPQGSALEKTAAVADSLESILKRDQRVKSVTSFIGCGSPRFHTSYAPSLPGSNFAQFIVNTESNEATVEILNEYAPKYTDYFPEAMVRFKQMDFSEANIPIEVRISGNNLDDLKLAADSVMQELRKNPDLILIRTNFLENMPGISVQLDEDESTRLGINKTTTSIGLAGRFGNGLPLTTIWDGDYAMKVMLKNNNTGNMCVEDVNNTYLLALVPGTSVPLRQVASVAPEWTDGQIVRRNGIRTLSVQADVARNVNVTEVTSKIQRSLENIHLSENVTISYGGAKESDEESLPQIIGGLVIAVFIIFMILLFHFRKINLALLIIFSMILCIPGAALGIWIVGLDISLTGILGLNSLMGILTRNGIIMVDYAEELKNKHRYPVYEAIYNSALRRMRPIFLTSAAASMGVIPMIISGSSLWSPLGTIVFFGTIVSMLLILTLLPIVYWLLFREKVIDRK